MAFEEKAVNKIPLYIEVPGAATGFQLEGQYGAALPDVLHAGMGRPGGCSPGMGGADLPDIFLAGRIL